MDRSRVRQISSDSIAPAHIVAVYHRDGTTTTLCGYPAMNGWEPERETRLCENCRDGLHEILRALI